MLASPTYKIVSWDSNHQPQQLVAVNFAQLAFTNLLTKYLYTNRIAKLDLGFLAQLQSVGLRLSSPVLAVTQGA